MIEALTIRLPEEIADPSSDPPASLEKVEVYNQFFNHPDKYQKFHIHLVGARAKPGAVNPGVKSLNQACFGLFSKLSKPDPMAVVETIGEDTGSTGYFPIGRYSYAAQKKSEIPVWDTKTVILGNQNVMGIQMTIYDGREDPSKVLFKTSIASKDLPTAGSGWKEFVIDEESDNFEGMDLIVKIKVTNGTDKIVSKADVAHFFLSTDEVTYSEYVIDYQEKMDKALVQCWRHSEPSSKAVLWVMGRNDCFMHPHVAKALFTGRGYDLYVLNYSCDGMCRKRGWVTPTLNSHNRHGDFGVYVDEVAKAIEIMNRQNYETKIGYAHSTGGPVLLKYLMEMGDDYFTSFIFNSPFLDWGHCGGDLYEFIIERGFTKMPRMLLDNDFKFNVVQTPDEFVEPIKCMGDEIVISAWAAKLWSQYFFDFRCRPLHQVPLTIGFTNGVTGVHEELLKMKEDKKYVTVKPMLCITSRGDDTLESDETLTRIDIVGPNRSEIELHHNAHDVFLSSEKSDTDMALKMVQGWMVSEGLW